MKLITLLICIIALGGCSAKVVYVPVKCGIIQRTKPVKTPNIVENIKNILIYTELLEKDLDFCINGVSEKP